MFIPETEPLPGGGGNILNVPPSNCFLLPLSIPETLTFISLALALVGCAAQPFLVFENLALALDGTIVLDATPGIEIDVGFLNPL